MRNKTVSMLLILACMFVAMFGTGSITPVAAEPQAEQLPQSELSFDWLKDRHDFAHNNDSVELIIGISDTRPGSYAELMNLINKKGSELVNTVSMKGEVRAVVVDVPLGAMSSFVTEAQVSGLARYIEPNFKFQATF